MTHIDLVETRADAALPVRTGIYARFGKRALDLILSLCLMPVLLPLIVLCWALTRAQGQHGFYAHSRIGQHGRRFRCHKICTMRPDAEAILHTHLQRDSAAADEWERTRKLKNDPRVTRLGRFLRRTSLDELPQIFNVLKGDMSLVGPRPITEEELGYYAPAAWTYLDQKPGVTGLWQVYGRSDGCYRNRVRLDRDYLALRGFYTDLGLIWRTALLPVRPSGS